MKDASIGKLRGIQQLANPNGLLTIVALDHRDSLRRMLNKENPDAVRYQDIVDFKLDMCRAAGASASAVLLDPIYGAAQAIAAGVLPGHTGLLVSMESTGYTGEKTARITELLPDWGPKKAKRMGASAAKLLIYFRPDLKEVAARQLELVAELARQCLQEDLPLLVEAVSYPVAEVGVASKKYADLLPKLVIESTRQLTALPIDVLKVEFPGDLRFEQDEDKLLLNCQQLNQAATLPWVLLSAGADYTTFKKQVEIACKAGASGFLAGRALWQEGAKIQNRDERMEFFRSVAVSRIKELTSIANSYGTPWYVKMGRHEARFEAVSADWYQKYE